MYSSNNPVMIDLQRFLDQVHHTAFNGDKVEPAEVIAMVLKAMDEIHRLEEEITSIYQANAGEAL